MKIRASTPADSAHAVEIWQRAVDATHDFLTPEDRAAIEQEVKAFLPDAQLWLAVDAEDRAIAFMLLDGSNMEALFIDPDWRGKGVGKTLVDHAIALCGAITTEVNEQNGQAVGFYEKMGFIPVGRSDRDGQGRAYPLIHLRFSPQN